MTELEKFTEWVKSEAVIIEHAAEHTLQELKQAFASGLLMIKNDIHQTKQQTAGAALSKAITPISVASTETPPHPQTANVQNSIPDSTPQASSKTV